jgi:hypothetical protein
VQLYTAERLRAARDDRGNRGPADLIAGVSVGSLTALLAAQDRLARLRQLWGEVDGTKFFQRLAVDFNLLDGLYSLIPLRKKIRPELRHELYAELRIGLVHLRGKRYRSVDAAELTRDQLADALIASCTQPGIHEEVTFRGRKAGDGGLLHVLPYPEPLVEAEAVSDPDAGFYEAPPDADGLDRWTVHAVLCTPADRRHPPEQGKPVRSVGRALECLVDAVVLADVKRLQRWAALGAEVYLYAPPEWPGDPFDADRDTIRWRVDKVGPEVWASRRRLDG